MTRGPDGRFPAALEWTADRDEVLVEGYRAGETYAAIAERLGDGAELHHVASRVEKLRRQGVDLPRRKPRWTKENRDRLVRLRGEGVSLNELERIFDLTRGSINAQIRALRKEGFPVDPPGGAR